jgi:SAM-dependent methyltransferase
VGERSMRRVVSGSVTLGTGGLKGAVIRLIGRIFKSRTDTQRIDLGRMEEYFAGRKGLEIGGPSPFFAETGPMPIYSMIANLDGVNFAPSTIWTGSINKTNGYRIDGKRFGKQYILDTVDLTSIPEGTYDFVLSCNNIEHIANPLKAVEQWLFVLKENGVLVIVAPRKEGNFDRNRDVVTFNHLVSDYLNGVREDDLSHLEEILAFHDLALDPPAGTTDQFRERSLKNFENRCLHHHVFDLGVLKKIYRHFNIAIIKGIRIYTDYIIIGRKRREMSR